MCEKILFLYVLKTHLVYLGFRIPRKLVETKIELLKEENIYTIKEFMKNLVNI